MRTSGGNGWAAVRSRGAWLGSVVAVALAASEPLAAQGWTVAGSGPSVSFGTGGDLLANDGQGLIGYDEAAGATLLPAGSGWLATPAAPGSRQLAALSNGGARLFLFGGLTGTGLTNDLWRFDRGLGNWVPMQGPATAFGPAPRAGARILNFAGGWPVLLFGGSGTAGLSNDTWVMIEVQGLPVWVPQPTPAALVGRIGHALANGPGETAVLFGGMNGTALGDTWIFSAQAPWAQHLGLGPPPAADCRMAYDRGRDMTVLLHPNGDTWEWNGYSWRQVPAVGAPVGATLGLHWVPGQGGGLRALRATAQSLDTFAYTPSIADFQLTYDVACLPNGVSELSLAAWQRSLPVLGQSLHLRVSNALPNSLLVGAYEFSGGANTYSLGCGCILALDGTGTATQFVPGSGPNRDWFLPIANDPLLLGVPIDVQPVMVDPNAPCFLMTSPRGTLVPGR